MSFYNIVIKSYFNNYYLICSNRELFQPLKFYDQSSTERFLKDLKTNYSWGRNLIPISEYSSSHTHSSLISLIAKKLRSQKIYVYPLPACIDVPYTVNHIPKNTPNSRRPDIAMIPKYLTIHSTGNANSTAENERGWLTNTSNTRTASYHIVVDDSQAIECIPFNEKAYHAGDGSGTGNTKTIGLEICESGNRVKTLENAISLAAKILSNKGWSSKELRQHNDWSGKNCPRILRQSSNYGGDKSQTWDWFKGEVEKILWALKL